MTGETALHEEFLSDEVIYNGLKDAHRVVL